MTRSGDRRRQAAGTILILLAAAASPGQTPASPPPDKGSLDATLAAGTRELEASHYAAARQTFEEAICRATEYGDAALLEQAWTGLARARWSVGDNAGSLEADLHAVDIQSRLHDPDRFAFTLNAVGLDLYSTGHHDEALGYYVLGLEQDPRPPTRALLLLNIGLVFRFQGRFADAESVLQEALALRRVQNKPRSTALTLNALGTVARVTGHYALALEYHNEALALRRTAQDRFGQAQTLNNIANIYGDQGEFERALEIHREALRIAREIDYTRQIGLSTNNIGAALDDLGRPGEALEQARAAIALYRKTGDRTNLADSLSQAGGYLVELGQTGAARVVLSEALDLGRAIGEPEREIVSLQGLAEADLKDGKAEDALGRLDPALEIADRSGFARLEWRLRLDRARALRALGRSDASLADLAAARDAINILRARVGTDAGKIGFVDQCQEVFEELAVGLSAAGREIEALETAEAARSRAFADLLSQRQVIGKPVDRSALAEIRGAQTRARFAEASDKSHGAEIDAAVGRLEGRDPELASLIAVASPLFDEIRQTAARLNATILEYLVTNKQWHAWVVSPAGELHAVHRQEDREGIADRVRSVREDLEKGDPNRAPTRRLSRSLRELDRLLLAPVERWLPSSPEGLVLVVPHGPLALVPWAALVNDSGRPFAERHTLALAPAVSVFRYTLSKGSRQGGRNRRALFLADPIPPQDSGLSRLPGSRWEVKRIARRIGSGARTLIGRDATEAAFKTEAPEFAILHLATHGLISEDRPLDSSVLLGEGQGEDGYLRVDEIAGLDLHADLVVLSGCRTGLGRLSGDGILGMTRAFLYAGTSAIVVSQWDVSDRATSLLMDRFYAALASGQGKAQALRTAQIATRRRFPNPSLWAGFVLIGEPR